MEFTWLYKLLLFVFSCLTAQGSAVLGHEYFLSPHPKSPPQLPAGTQSTALTVLCFLFFLAGVSDAGRRFLVFRERCFVNYRFSMRRPFPDCIAIECCYSMSEQARAAASSCQEILCRAYRRDGHRTVCAVGFSFIVPRGRSAGRGPVI